MKAPNDEPETSFRRSAEHPDPAKDSWVFLGDLYKGSTDVL